MSSSGWRFHAQYLPGTDTHDLFIAYTQPFPGRQRMVVRPFTVEVIPEGGAYSTPTLREGREDREDGIGDVTNFLQGALECAWEMGLRPRGFADHSSELKAVRYHLEDMRAIAKVPVR